MTRESGPSPLEKGEKSALPFAIHRIYVGIHHKKLSLGWDCLDLLWTLLPNENPEKRHMGRFDDFAMTLEKKIRREIEAEMFQPTSPRSQMEVQDELPLGFAWLLGQQPSMQKDTQTQTRGQRAYGVREKPRPPHVLNTEQRQALEHFLKWGTELSPAFRAQELKRAWRQVAMRTHPDHGGTDSAFREARSAYQTLLSVFKNAKV